jgi:tyrosinase
MRFNSHVALTLLASTLTNAVPTPQAEPSDDSLPTSASSNVSEASEQLAQLLEFAQSAANASLEENSSKAKRGGCTLSKLTVRREWYVSASSRSIFGALALMHAVQRVDLTLVHRD